jgi:hypothetical protein
MSLRPAVLIPQNSYPQKREFPISYCQSLFKTILNHEDIYMADLTQQYVRRNYTVSMFQLSLMVIFK